MCIVCLAAAGCAGDQPGSPGERQGIAEVRLDAASLASANVTRVTMEAAGQTQDLVFNPVSRSYDAAVLLPSGSQTLVGRAFSNDVLVGASNPVTIDVTPGNVTRVMLRILDLTLETPAFGPLFDSLTFPTTVNAGATATFALSVIAPAHDPVTYLWSSDCADSTFTAPQTAATGWSKPSPGSCRIDVVATSNGFSIAQHFVIVVFPEGTDGGAVNVNGVFITRPRANISVRSNDQTCSAVSDDDHNSSCPITIAAPDTLEVSINVFGWAPSTPGDIVLSDNCGGRFGINGRFSDSLLATWMPPAVGGLCVLTARTSNNDGVTAVQSFAVLTRPGEIPITRPPTMSVFLGGCSFLAPQDEPRDCGQFEAISMLRLQVHFMWEDGLPGIGIATDDCGGGQVHSTNTFELVRTWPPSGTPGTTCHLTVSATNLQGVTSAVSAQYRLF